MGRSNMDLYPYNALSLTKRAEHLWSKGDFIAVCRRKEPYVLYYMINDFFVELEYDQGRVQILGLTAFRTGERYERMLNALQLDVAVDPT